MRRSAAKPCETCVNAALGKATVRECSIMEDARLDAELPAAFATVIRPWQERARSDAEPASVPIGHVARQLWKHGGNTDGNESGSLR